MSQNKQSSSSFDAAKVGNFFQKTLGVFDKFLASLDSDRAKPIRKKLRSDLKEYHDRGVLSVAFVGQYSAGKSTIISALTGRRDIHIDADIATDRTTPYTWNSIEIIDTPGLYTERKDHDDITYNAIAKADLLVFCITSMLFDSITSEHFKQLAYDRSYLPKMMLVVNKLSQEAGEDDEKIANYKESIAEALKPHNMDEFPICFIDAKDYCDGIDEGEEFLVELSRFETFLSALNEFTKTRSILAKYDTPVRIALECVNESELLFPQNSSQDAAFLETLNRLSRIVRKERSNLEIKIKGIALKMYSKVVEEGRSLANSIGTEPDLKQFQKEVELNVRKHYESTEAEIQSAFDNAIASIREEVEIILNSDLVESFVACLNKDATVSARNLDAGIDVDRLRQQVGFLNEIGSQFSISITNAATRSVLKTAGSGSFRAMDVAGSSLHKGVLAAGKFVGFKFKPWQAVGVAKNLGNAAKFLGPALGLFAVVVDCVEVHQASQREAQIAEAVRQVNSQFSQIAKGLESEIEMMRLDFDDRVYDAIDRAIMAKRQQQQTSQVKTSKDRQRLHEIRQQFERILKYIK